MNETAAPKRKRGRPRKVKPEAGGEPTVTAQLVELQALTVPQPPRSTLELIQQASRDPAVDVSKMRELLAMQKGEQDRMAEMAFASDFVACQADIGPVFRDLKSDKARYASYESLDRKLRPIYTRHGFSVLFNNDEYIPPSSGGEPVLGISCELLHRLGGKRQFQIHIPVVTKGPKGADVMTPVHATGSAATYGRRYLLAMVFNLAFTDSDDDGALAGGQGPITEDQLAELRAMLKGEEGQKHISEKSFALYFSVDDLAKLPAHKFTEAAAAIAEKRRQMTEAA